VEDVFNRSIPKYKTTISLAGIDNIAGIESLRVVDASKNMLEGSLPWFDQLPSLRFLDLSRNCLDGSLPMFRPIPLRSNALAVLRLNDNLLSSSIPAALLQIQSLLVLDLHDNDLTGAIPSAISSLPALQYVDVSSNSLSGRVPEMAVSSYLSVADNDLGGSLGGWVCDVRYFDGRGNTFYCPLPNCCGAGGTLCDAGCEVVAVSFFSEAWRVPYMVVGTVLLLFLLCALVWVTVGVPDRIRDYLGYGTFG